MNRTSRVIERLEESFDKNLSLDIDDTDALTRAAEVTLLNGGSARVEERDNHLVLILTFDTTRN